MKREDLDQVMYIEQTSFKSPWKRSFFEYDLQRQGGYCYVAKEKEEIIGYVNAWHIADEMHLANIAVHVKHRHKGIGIQLLQKVIEVAVKNRCQAILLEVRISNLVARKLYEKFEFVRLYTRKKYYPDGEEALVYEKRLREF